MYNKKKKKQLIQKKKKKKKIEKITSGYISYIIYQQNLVKNIWFSLNNQPWISDKV